MGFNKECASLLKKVGAFFIKVMNLLNELLTPTGLYAQLGYKTNGYLEGEQLAEGMIIWLGLAFRHGI